MTLRDPIFNPADKGAVETLGAISIETLGAISIVSKSPSTDIRRAELKSLLNRLIHMT